MNNFEGKSRETVWKIEARRTLLDTPWLGVEEQDIRTGKGKLLQGFYTLRQPDWVLVLAQCKTDLWIMVRQYRHGIGRWLWEFPAGIVDAGESPLQSARRELLEETGYQARQALLLRTLPVNPDRQSGLYHIVLAEETEGHGLSHLEDGEELNTYLRTTRQVEQMIKNGELEHPHHIAAWKLLMG